jgi:hypothetical protein
VKQSQTDLTLNEMRSKLGKTPIRQAAFYNSLCCYLTKFNKSGYPFWPILGTYLNIHGNSNVHGKNVTKQLETTAATFLRY